MCIKISQYSSIIISKKSVFQRTTFIYFNRYLFHNSTFIYFTGLLVPRATFISQLCISICQMPQGGLVILQIQTKTTAPVTLQGN